MTIGIYIDANVLVSSEIKGEPQHKESKKFIDYILKNDFKDIKIFTSKFTLLEIASTMIRRTKNKDKAYSILYRLTRSWEKNISPLEPEKRRSWSKLLDELIETAIELRTKSGDTIHAQIVKDYEIDFLITWNKKDFKSLIKCLKKRKIVLKVMTPTEILIELEKIKNKKTSYYDTLEELLKGRYVKMSKLSKDIRTLGNKLVHSTK